MAQQKSIRTQLIDILCQKLVDGENVKKVFRSMYQAVQAENLPVCAVFPVEETTEHDEHEDGLMRVLRLNIVYVAAKGEEDQSASLDQIIDAALVWIETKVMEDDRLGGLALHTHAPRISWQFESGEFGFVGATVETEIEYYTLGDPSVSNI